MLGDYKNTFRVIQHEGLFCKIDCLKSDKSLFADSVMSI